MPSPTREGFLCWMVCHREETSMFQRESDVRAYTCPDCGSKLARERDLLRCESHGAFFA